jgi:hypothetical protein
MVHRLARLCVISCVVLVGCGDIEVHRVTTANDEKLDGFRYYLARPYVAVKKAFPLRGEDAYVRGIVVKLDDKLVIQTIGNLPASLKAKVGDRISTEGIKTLGIQERGTGTTRQARQGNTGGDGNGGTDTTGGKGKADTGNTGTASTDNGADSNKGGSGGGGAPSDPVLKLNDLFDVVILPDYNEKYAIKLHAPVIGKATTSLVFRDGWMLESVNTTVDNTAGVAAIKDTISKLIDLAIAKVTPPTSSTGNAGGGGGQNKGTVTQSLLQREGTVVLLHITEFDEAQPGLYPLLKPGEDNGQGIVSVPNLPIAGSKVIPVALPIRPYTAVPFNSVSRIQVEVVSAFTASNANNQNPQKPGDGANAFDKDEVDALTAALKDLVPGELGNGSVKSASITNQNLIVNLTGVDKSKISVIQSNAPAEKLSEKVKGKIKAGHEFNSVVYAFAA